MSQPEGLELVPAGTLNRPGPVGRFVRFVLGALCLSVVASITVYWVSTARHPIASLGSFDSLILGVPLNLWLGYFYGHLGVSFLLAAAIGTPGCEMRSIPELIGRARGTPSHEHRCPVGFLARIDEWERGRMR